jgi:hypothetical protein
MLENQCTTGKLCPEPIASRGEGAQEATLEVCVQAAATLAALTVALSASVQIQRRRAAACPGQSTFRALCHGLKNRPRNEG